MLDSTYNMFNDAQVQQSQRFAASYNNPDSKSPPFHQRPQWNHKMNWSFKLLAMDLRPIYMLPRLVAD